MVTLETVLDEIPRPHIYGARYQFSFLRVLKWSRRPVIFKRLLKMHHVQTYIFEARFQIICTRLKNQVHVMYDAFAFSCFTLSDYITQHSTDVTYQGQSTRVVIFLSSIKMDLPRHAELEVRGMLSVQSNTAATDGEKSGAILDSRGAVL